MLVFYLLILTFVVLVAYAGYDATMRLVAYADLTIRYQIIQVRMYFMRKRLQKSLNLDRKQLIKDLKEKTNDRSQT